MSGERIKLLAASGLGSGLLPGAPGTWGSALACGLWLAGAYGLGALGPGGHFEFRIPDSGAPAGHGGFLQSAICPLHWLTIAAAAAAGALCVMLGPWVIRRTGRPDPSCIVLDEWAGQLLALLAIPQFLWTGWRLAMAAGVQFVLFRLFDIFKPYPCRRLERLPGGWGILADDLAAGVYAALAGHAALLIAGALLAVRARG